MYITSFDTTLYHCICENQLMEDWYQTSLQLPEWPGIQAS